MATYKINPKLTKPPVTAVIPKANRVVVFEGQPGDGQLKATQADLKALYEANCKTAKGTQVVIKVESAK